MFLPTPFIFSWLEILVNHPFEKKKINREKEEEKNNFTCHIINDVQFLYKSWYMCGKILLFYVYFLSIYFPFFSFHTYSLKSAVITLFLHKLISLPPHLNQTNSKWMHTQFTYAYFIIYFLFSPFIARHLSYYFMFLLLIYTFIVKETQLEWSSACLCQFLFICFFTEMSNWLVR